MTVMSFEKTSYDLEFRSTLGGKILLWLCGIAPILLSTLLFVAFLVPPQVTGRNLVSVVVFELILWVLGCAILFSACEVQIVDGQLRFRRVFVWRSVPLDSITRVEALRAPGVYVRVDYWGKRYRLIFYPGGYERSYRPPVVEFLEEVWRRNTERREAQP